MAKGSSNERDKCREWSLWWSEGIGINPPRDDIFWRTAGSGARARVRTAAGKRVFRGYGDMMAEDPIGQPLIDRCTFEFKKGYPDLSLLNCIVSKQKRPLLIQFLQEVEKDASDAGNEPILVIHQNRKKAVIFISHSLIQELRNYFGLPSEEKLLKIYDYRIIYDYSIMSLPGFFKWANAEFFLFNRTH